MFKILGKGGRRNAGSRGVAQASSRIKSPMNKLHATEVPPPHTAFQGVPSDPTHGFDSNSPRLSGLEKR